jgi:hypothetical protein
LQQLLHWSRRDLACSQSVECGELWTSDDRNGSQRGSAPSHGPPWRRVVDDDGRGSWRQAARTRQRNIPDDVYWCLGWWCRCRRKRWASSDRRLTSDAGGWDWRVEEGGAHRGHADAKSVLCLVIQDCGETPYEYQPEKESKK